MSFTTRCPACGTTFRIVPDQLKISDGWVRCGHCSDVFDATLFLEGDPVAVSAPVQAPSVVAASPPPVPAAHDDADEEWLLHSTPSTDGLPSGPGPEKADDSFSDELRWFAAQTKDDVQTSEVPVASPAPEPMSTEVAAVADVSPPPARPPVVATQPPTAAPEPARDDEVPVLTEPSFVRQARRKAFWQSPGVRVSLVAVCFALLVGLLAQWAVHDRDRLAARYPFSAPLLAALCRPLNCGIGPARDVEAVAIDSSNLVRRLGNFYSFDLVLKNSATLPLAVPALELSLTDTRDNVIVRRVFLPAELPGAPEVLPAQGAVSMSLRLSIADSGVSSMTGYRALVFYP